MAAAGVARGDEFATASQSKDLEFAMQTVLIVIHLMIVVALAVVVLLQRSEGGALGIGGGGAGGFFTGRGQANLLTRSTAILGAAFFAMSLVLSILASWNRTSGSVLDTVAPAGPSAPGSSGGVLDQLKQLQQSAPSAPAAPSLPVPSAPTPAPKP